VLALKLLSLVLQLLVLGIMARQLQAPYGWRQWRRAWAMLSLAALLMAGSRVYALWVPGTRLGVLLTIGVSLSMLMGLWCLTRILAQDVVLSVATDAAVIENDSFSVILAWDQQATRLFGWTAEEAMGQTLMQTIIPPRDWEAHRAGLARLLASDDPGRLMARTFAINARRKQGEEIPISVRIASSPQADGSLHFLGHARALGLL